jgi:hypothetical protein
MIRKPFVFENSFLFDCISEVVFSGYWHQLPNSELPVAKVYYFLYLDLHDILEIGELQ